MKNIINIFLPKEEKFFDMLLDLSENIALGSKEFSNFIKQLNSLSKEQKSELLQKIKATEQDCDKKVHQIIISLNKTFITPIDREDIHRLATLLDDIMDIIHDTSNHIVLYDLQNVPKQVDELCEIVYSCTEEIVSTVRDMPAKKDMSPHFRKLHALEKEADMIKNEAMVYLFSNGLDTINILKLKDIIEMLEAATDKSEDVSDVIEGIVIKHA